VSSTRNDDIDDSYPRALAPAAASHFQCCLLTQSLVSSLHARAACSRPNGKMKTVHCKRLALRQAPSERRVLAWCGRRSRLLGLCLKTSLGALPRHRLGHAPWLPAPLRRALAGLPAFMDRHPPSDRESDSTPSSEGSASRLMTSRDSRGRCFCFGGFANSECATRNCQVAAWLGALRHPRTTPARWSMGGVARRCDGARVGPTRCAARAGHAGRPARQAFEVKAEVRVQHRERGRSQAMANAISRHDHGRWPLGARAIGTCLDRVFHVAWPVTCAQ